jgi:hypothetical protein
MALNKTDVCREIASSTGMGQQAVKHVLDDLAALAGEELEDGEDFVVPGICKIGYRYTAPVKRGERFTKGDKVTNPFTGEERVATADSSAKKARVTMKLGPLGIVRALKPKTSPEAQAAFLKSTAGKAVVKRG